MSLIKRIRHKVNCSRDQIGNNILTDEPAHLLKPSAVAFEVTLFDDDHDALKVITDLDQLVLTVKRDDPRTGLALMQKTVPNADINFLLTLEEFLAGDSDACHALFVFSAAESNIELDETTDKLYLVLSGLDADGNEIAFANGVINVEESGAFADPPASIIEDEFYTKAQADARYLLAVDLSAKQNVITGGASTITSADLTASRALLSNGSGKVAVSAVTSTELGYLSGVTSALQTQLGAKQATITGGATTIASSNLTASRALASDGSGKVAVSAVTSTELGYLSGVTSLIQTQLAAKLSLAGGTMTGALTLSGAPSSNLHAATKLYVDTAVANLVASSPGTLDTLNELAAALGNDASFSTTVATSIGTKVPLAGGTMTGLLTLSGAPTTSLHAATKAYADLMLPLAGGTLTGALTLSGAPSSNLHAATKLYVDTADALKLNLTGGTLSGAVGFSGTAHAGLTVNRLTSTQVTALGSATNGVIVYDTTLAQFKFREADTWKSLGASGGSGWLSGSPDPDNGDGVDGNYYLKDDGSVWLKTSGAWSVFVAAPLPIAGGTMSGGLQFVTGLSPAITLQGSYAWTMDNDTDDFLLKLNGTTVIKADILNDVDFAAANAVKIQGVQILTTRQANIADTSGASLGSLETTVNALKAMIRVHGLMG